MENPFFTLSELIKKLENQVSIQNAKIDAFFDKSREELLISPAEACNIFHPKISKNTLKRWTDEGLLKDYRMGGRVFYRRTEIIESAKHVQRYKNKSLHKNTGSLLI